MDVPINIPVKRHIYKFLIRYWGDSYRLSTTNFLGCFIFHLIKKQRKSKPIETKYNPELFPCRYHVVVPDTYYFDRGIEELTPRTIQHFNNFMDSVFSFIFINTTESRLEEAPREKKIAYEKFIDDINLEEVDLTFDALKKDHYRFRKKREKEVLL